MKAGNYGVWRGQEYEVYHAHDAEVLLVRLASQPRPDGFDEHPRGWARRVPRGELSRLFVVRTVAVWQGCRVKVWSVHDDVAEVEASAAKAGDIPVHPAVVRENAYGDWGARVPVWELTEVVETVVDADP